MFCLYHCINISGQQKSPIFHKCCVTKLPKYSIPDVCIDERRLPLFIARATLRDMIAGLEARATGDAAR